MKHHLQVSFDHIIYHTTHMTMTHNLSPMQNLIREAGNFESYWGLSSRSEGMNVRQLVETWKTRNGRGSFRVERSTMWAIHDSFYMCDMFGEQDVPKNPGVLLDSSFTMINQISNVCKTSSSKYLKNWKCLLTVALTCTVNTFVTRRLDFNNTLM